MSPSNFRTITATGPQDLKKCESWAELVTQKSCAEKQSATLVVSSTSSTSQVSPNQGHCIESRSPNTVLAARSEGKRTPELGEEAINITEKIGLLAAQVQDSQDMTAF